LPPCGAKRGFTGALPPCGAKRGFTGALPPCGAKRGFTGALPPCGAKRGFTGALPPCGAKRGFTGARPPCEAKSLFSRSFSEARKRDGVPSRVPITSCCFTLRVKGSHLASCFAKRFSKRGFSTVFINHMIQYFNKL
jgi:hypothetical protein